MTIEQLETFSNTKPELRYLTEEIIKYLQANPGGGGGIEVAEGSDALTALWVGSQAAYDLLTPDSSTLYFIKE